MSDAVGRPSDGFDSDGGGFDFDGSRPTTYSPSLMPEDPLRLDVSEPINNKPLTAHDREALQAELAELEAQIKKKQSQNNSMRGDYQKEVMMLKRIAKKREDDAKKDQNDEKKHIEADDDASAIFYFSANRYCEDGFDAKKASAEVEAKLRKGMQKWMEKQAEKVTSLQEALVSANVRQANLDHLLSNAMGFLNVPNVEQFVDSILMQDIPHDTGKETCFAQTLKKLDAWAEEAALKIKDQMEADCMGNDNHSDAQKFMDKLNASVQNSATQVMQGIEREEAQKRDKIRQELMEAQEKRDLFEWHAENIFHCLPDGAFDEEESEPEELPSLPGLPGHSKMRRSQSAEKISLQALRTASKAQQCLPVTLAESFFEVCSHIGPMSVREAFQARRKMLNPGKPRRNLGTRHSLDLSHFHRRESWTVNRPRSNSIGSPSGVGKEMMKMFKDMHMKDALAEAAAPFMRRHLEKSVQTDIKCKHLGPIGLTALSSPDRIFKRGSTKRATLELEATDRRKSDGGGSIGLTGLASAIINKQRLSATGAEGNAWNSLQASKVGEGKSLESIVSLSGRWTLLHNQEVSNAVQAARTSVTGTVDTPLPPLQGKHRKNSISTEEGEVEGNRPVRRTSTIGGGTLDVAHEQDRVARDDHEVQRPMTSQCMNRMQDRTTPMPIRPQTSLDDSNRMLLEEGTGVFHFPNLPSMIPVDGELETLRSQPSQERSGVLDTSKELSSGGVVDISASFGDHSQTLEWQTSRDSQILPVPWASWTDGRGKPSYTRCGGWLVSLKQAQRGNERIQGSNSGHPLASIMRSVSSRTHNPKHSTSFDTFSGFGGSGHLSSTSPSAQLWQASIDHDVFLASENGTVINVDDFFDYPMEAEYNLSDDELAQLHAEVPISRRGRTRTRRRDASRSRSRGHASSGSHSQSRSRSRSASASPSHPRSPSVEKSRGVLGACLEPRARIWTPQHGMRQEDLQTLAETPELDFEGVQGIKHEVSCEPMHELKQETSPQSKRELSRTLRSSPQNC